MALFLILKCGGLLKMLGFSKTNKTIVAYYEIFFENSFDQHYVVFHPNP